MPSQDVILAWHRLRNALAQLAWGRGTSTCKRASPRTMKASNRILGLDPVETRGSLRDPSFTAHSSATITGA